MLSLVHSATAFTASLGMAPMRTPAPMMSVLDGQPFCKGLPGAIAPLGEFDPAGFSKDVDVLEINRLREAELVHGRVGMLAAAGFLVQEKFHPLFSGDGGPAIEQIPGLPPAMWFLLTISIGMVENLRIQKGWANPFEESGERFTNFPKSDSNFQQLRPDYVPGDLGFDPLGLKPDDPTEFRTMQEKELSHGRLGMIAAAGFMAQEAVTGSTWGTYWGIPAF